MLTEKQLSIYSLRFEVQLIFVIIFMQKTNIQCLNLCNK